MKLSECLTRSVLEKEALLEDDVFVTMETVKRQEENKPILGKINNKRLFHIKETHDNTAIRVKVVFAVDLQDCRCCYCYFWILVNKCIQFYMFERCPSIT